MATGPEFRSHTKWIKSFSLSRCNISPSPTPLSGTKMRKTKLLLAKQLLSTTAPNSRYQNTLNRSSDNSKALSFVCPRVVTATKLSDKDLRVSWSHKGKNFKTSNNKNPIQQAKKKKQPTYAKFGLKLSHWLCQIKCLMVPLPSSCSPLHFLFLRVNRAAERWLEAERQAASRQYHPKTPVESSPRKTTSSFLFLSDLWFYKAHQTPHAAQICMQSLLKSKQKPVTNTKAHPPRWNHGMSESSQGWRTAGKGVFWVVEEHFCRTGQKETEPGS